MTKAVPTNQYDSPIGPQKPKETTKIVGVTPIEVILRQSIPDKFRSFVSSGGGGGGSSSSSTSATATVTKTPTQQVTDVIQRAAERLGKSVKDITPSNITSQMAFETKQLRTAAGTFGRDIGPLTERNILKQFKESQQTTNKTVTTEPNEFGAELITSVSQPKITWKQYLRDLSRGDLLKYSPLAYERLGSLKRSQDKNVAEKNFKKFVGELLSAGIEPLVFINALKQDPIGTIKNIPANAKISKDFITSGDLARFIKNEPARTTGRIIGEVLVAKSLGKGVSKGAKLTGDIAERLDNILLKRSLNKADIRFLAEAEPELLDVIATTKVRGKTIVTRSKLDLLTEEGAKTSFLGKEAQFVKLNNRQIAIIRRRLGTVVESLKSQPKYVRRVKGGRISYELPNTRGLKGTTLGRDIDKTVIRRKPIVRGGSIKEQLRYSNVKRVKPNQVRSMTVGTITPTQAENILKINAGNPKFRVYKQGGISYVFNPKIQGLLRIRPTTFDSFFKHSFLVQKVQTAQPLGLLAADIAKQSIIKEASKLTFVKSAKVAKTVELTAKPVTSTIRKALISKQETQKVSSLKKPIPTGITNSIPKQTYKLNSKSSQRLRQQQQTRQEQKSNQVTRIKSTTAQGQETYNKLRLGQRQQQLQRQRQKTRQVLLNSYRFKTSTLAKRIPKVPTLLPKAMLSTSKKYPTTMRKAKGYEVFTRKGKKISKFALTKKSALGLGIKSTDVGIKASFFIKPTYKAPRRIPSLEKAATKLSYKFRPSKKVAGLIVEKPKFRLEKRGRTAEVKEIQRARRIKAYG